MHRPVSAYLKECGEEGERAKKKSVLKYFSPPPATQTRPRVLVSLQPHASTAHLFLEEEESKRAGMRKTEAGGEITPG